MRYAVHTHVGVYWDGGVGLLGVYRFAWLACLHCWWHVRVNNPMRRATVVPVRDGTVLLNYYNSEKQWSDAMCNECTKHYYE